MAYILGLPTPSDYAVLSTWVADATACMRWAGPNLPFPLDAENLPQLLNGQDATRRSYILCNSERPGDPLGFGQVVQKESGISHLARIIISPQARGNGLGRVLCQQLIAKATAVSSMNLLTLNVYRDNRKAMGLYLSLGFAEADKQPRSDMVLMQKLLK
ncbi:GNAT family N-acetyltransferase [Sodalis ligni]|uniref:L-amino acid N-acyltransferase YncA n=1 Tax=Sodalis ligni TaxID=2697027 RepID=A0A4V2Q3H6_9GAMM|nr:GNAT family N-acetyltransferase [Sodalis ligni]TCL06808.1 L-amino acid N-acyltransferase YncA [Sodalis ligni]